MNLDIIPKRMFEYTKKSNGEKVIYLEVFINKALKPIDVTEVFEKFNEEKNGNK